MTAINVRVTEHAVHLLTDGAAYDAKGKITQFMGKVDVAPEMGAVITASGYTRISTALLVYLRQANVDNFDGCWFALPDAVRKLFDALGKTVPEAAKISSTFIMAGWSTERDGPEAFIISNFDDDRHGSMRKAFEIKAIRGFESPNIDGRINMVTDDNAEIRGLNLLEAQRRRPGRPQDASFEVVHGVGGFAQLTTVTHDQITVKVLKRWPDLIGHRIDPRSKAA